MSTMSGAVVRGGAICWLTGRVSCVGCWRGHSRAGRLRQRPGNLPRHFSFVLGQTGQYRFIVGSRQFQTGLEESQAFAEFLGIRFNKGINQTALPPRRSPNRALTTPRKKRMRARRAPLRRGLLSIQSDCAFASKSLPDRKRQFPSSKCLSKFVESRATASEYAFRAISRFPFSSSRLARAE